MKEEVNLSIDDTELSGDGSSNINDLPSQEEEIRVPAQYDGLSSEIVEQLWVPKIYIDQEKTEAEKQRRQKILDFLRKRESESVLIREGEISRVKELDKVRQKLAALNDQTPEAGETNTSLGFDESNKSQNGTDNLQKVIDNMYFRAKKGEVLPGTQHEDFIREAQQLDKDFARNLPARGLEGVLGPDVVDDFKRLKVALKNDFRGQFWGSFYIPEGEGVEEEKQLSGLGYSAKHEGFMLIGSPGRDFGLENLLAVLVPRQYESAINALKSAYPDIHFITVDEIKNLDKLVDL